MAIVTPADFIGEVNIPNNGDTYNGVKGNVQYFIDKYEPLFLEAFLGYDLYQEYLAGISPVPVEPATDPVTYEPIPEKWADIQSLTKPLILNYIFNYYKREENSYNSGVGTVKSKGENSTNFTHGYKMTDRWNEMVKGVRKAVSDWDKDVYGAYYLAGKIACGSRNGVPNIFLKINMFGL